MLQLFDFAVEFVEQPNYSGPNAGASAKMELKAQQPTGDDAGVKDGHNWWRPLV